MLVIWASNAVLATKDMNCWKNLIFMLLCCTKGSHKLDEKINNSLMFVQ